jgi:hypothetical protein
MKHTLILTFCFLVNYSLSAQENYVVPVRPGNEKVTLGKVEYCETHYYSKQDSNCIQGFPKYSILNCARIE